MAPVEQPVTRQCSRCQHGPEVFQYLNGLYEFDVAQARTLVGAGREPLEIDDDSVRASVKAVHAAQRLADGINAVAEANRVDVHVYTNSSSFPILIGAHQAGSPLGPSQAVAAFRAFHRLRAAPGFQY